VTDNQQSWREREAAKDAARVEANFGMYLIPDERQEPPAKLAWEAAQRGDLLFQIDLPVSYVQGSMGATTFTAVSRTVRPVMAPEHIDYLGQIEAQGWRLEHVSTSYLVQGEITGGNVQTAYHGTLMALYVFRRAA
jgi:hypothetical protein